MMEPLTSIENKCLLVRSRARKKSLPSFVKTMQKYFPNYFNDAVFTSHSIRGDGHNAPINVEGVLVQHSALPPQVIRHATHYFIRLRYNNDTSMVFKSVLDKYREDPTTYRCVQALIRDVNITTLAGTAAIVQLVCLEYGKDTSNFPAWTKLYDDIRRLIIHPATEACRVLNRHVVYGLDREVVAMPGCLIESSTLPVLTESAIWLISFSATAASSDHRLRLLTLYTMMGMPSYIKQLAVINPHSGIYSTIDVDSIPGYRLEDLRDCLYGTPELTVKALHELQFEKRAVRQAENFSLWYRLLTSKAFLPVPYISLMLSLASGALDKGVSVDEMIIRLTRERESIRNTGKASGLPPSMFFIDTVMTMFVINGLRPEDMVFVLGVVETLLRWFNRVSHFTRLKSMSVKSSMFQDETDDVIYVMTNNQVSIVKVNFDELTKEGADILIRQQVKLNNLPGQPLRHGMLRDAPMVSVVNPLLGEALCYETRALPSVVYDLILSDLLNK